MGKRTNKLFWVLLASVLKQKERTAIQLVRLKTATAYVKGIRTARLAFLGYLALTALIVLLISGFILFHLGLALFLDWPLRDRALLLMICGGVYFLIALLVFCIMASQRLWMRCSGANKMVSRAVRGESLSGEKPEKRDRCR